MKKCSCCGLEKDESDFFKKRENTLEGFCKECKKEKLRKRKAQDPDKYFERERLRSEKRRQTNDWKEWRKDHQSRKRKEISEKALNYYYENNVLEKQKIWKANNKEKLRQYTKKDRHKRPLNHAARSFVYAAIKEGILVRPDQCSRCLKKCRAEAHHEDYMKPLEVIWLCRSCHGKEHRKTR